MMHPPSTTRLVRRSLLLCVLASGALGAQSVGSLPLTRYDSREQLEAQAQAAERAHRTSEAWLLRARLKNGDFQEGDRIVVVLEGHPAAPDTMQVRAGKVLQFPRMADLALEGVLRSELTDTIRHHLSRYLTNPGVRATPLLPLAVLGSVRSPGYFYAPADFVLRDVVMRAGGPTPDADLNKAVIRRGGQVIWNADDVRVALTDGLSLDRLHLRAGDELFVPQQRRRFAVSTLVTMLSAGAALTVAILQIQRH